MTHTPALASALLCFTLATAADAATTLHVEANGLDGPSCGTVAVACRSISYAINRAAPGDTVLVGPGRYGDLNHDGDRSDPGEEVSGSESSLINIDKPLRVVSSHGAALTIIDAIRANFIFRELKTYAVRLYGTGITFGAPDAGFTILGAEVFEEEDHIRTGVYAQATGDIRVEGNVVIGLDTGFYAFGDTGSVVLNGNYASGNSVGYIAETQPVVGKIALTHNVANGIGSSPLGGNGFAFGTAYVGPNPPVQRTAITATGNVASGNGLGFVFASRGPLVFQNNTAAGNFGPGAQTRQYPANDPRLARTYTVSGFSAIGNLQAGIDLGINSRVNVSISNFIGNDTAHGCGIHNLGGPVNAANNYWGAKTGPGPGRADAAGGNCDEAPGVTTATPFKTSRLNIAK